MRRRKRFAEGYRDDNPAGDTVVAALPGAKVRTVHRRALPVPALGDVVHAAGVDAVPHGFRSSFRDWAAECTDSPHEVCELALAHVNGNRVEVAYQRTDLFVRRRVLMNDWAVYVA